MIPSTTSLTPDEYSRAVMGPRDEVLDSILRKSLAEDGMPTIQVDDAAGRVLQLLTLLAQPTRALEIGTLFGYSTIHIARALPIGGSLTTIEIDPHTADIARRNIAMAGFDSVVDVVTADALDYLAGRDTERFEFIFIDGEKSAYPEYLKTCYPLLREGGVLVADDAFAHGDFAVETDRVMDSQHAINTYNRAVARAPQLYSAFIGTNAGMMVSVKRVNT